MPLSCAISVGPRDGTFGTKSRSRDTARSTDWMDGAFDGAGASGAELMGRSIRGTVLHPPGGMVAAHRAGTAPASAAFAPWANIFASVRIMAEVNPRSAAARAAGPEPAAV